MLPARSAGVTACFLQNEPTSFPCYLSKCLWHAGVVKASVNSATYKVAWKDPKPSELAMDRVNEGEIPQEARTREPFNTLG